MHRGERRGDVRHLVAAEQRDRDRAIEVLRSPSPLKRSAACVDADRRRDHVRVGCGAVVRERVADHPTMHPRRARCASATHDASPIETISVPSSGKRDDHLVHRVGDSVQCPEALHVLRSDRGDDRDASDARAR